MTYSKRLYQTKVVKIPRQIGGELVDTQVPYLASLPIDPNGVDDPYHWDVVYDANGDLDGKTPGVHTTCIVGVYTDEQGHAALAQDPEIMALDYAGSKTDDTKKTALESKAIEVNPKVAVQSLDWLATPRSK